MRRKGRERTMPPAELPMTPMIDLVFLLLVFFMVSLKPMDVFAHLDVSRRAWVEGELLEHPLKIGVGDGIFSLEGRVISEQMLDERLHYFVGLDSGTTVVVQCAVNSRHEMLVKVLNLCAKAGISNVSLLSAK